MKKTSIHEPGLVQLHYIYFFFPLFFFYDLQNTLLAEIDNITQTIFHNVDFSLLGHEN